MPCGDRVAMMPIILMADAKPRHAAHESAQHAKQSRARIDRCRKRNRGRKDCDKR
jgi:hypothetical protein